MTSYFAPPSMFSDKMLAESKLGYHLQPTGSGYQAPPSPYYHSAVDVTAAAMTSLQPYGSSNGYPLMSAWSHRPDILSSADYNGYESALTSGYDVKSWSNNSTQGGALPTGATAFLPLHTRLSGNNRRIYILFIIYIYIYSYITDSLVCAR